MSSPAMHFQHPREDDVLECFLYPKFCYLLPPDQITDEMLYEEIDKFNTDIRFHVENYLWHRDTLKFEAKSKQALQLDNIAEDISISSAIELLPHIHFSLRFDEDVGDEWFVVYLIINLTKKYSGLIARVVDTDGEFLMTEAAEVLPKWATPEACENRIFIMNGSVHAVKGEHKTCKDILNNLYLQSQVFELKEVQSVINKKINEYPAEIEKRKHKARAYLPLKAASILRKDPSLISSAIRAICHSDPLERKVCHAMRYLPPEQRTMANIKMTKCLYAMVTHCRYSGDLRTGWDLPLATDSKYKSTLLGIKIACGLEILIVQAQEKRKKKGQMTSNDASWFAFSKKLEDKGYYREFLEGSQEHQKLTNQARSYFEDHSDMNCMCKVTENKESERLLNLYETLNCDTKSDEELSSLSPEDSDSWLNVDPEQLEGMLERQFGILKNPNQSITIQDKLQDFINQKSEIDGVHFMGQRDFQYSDTDKNLDNNGIDFDPDAFDTALQDILDLVIPGGDGEFDDSSEESLGGDNEDPNGELNKYMKLLDSQLVAAGRPDTRPEHIEKDLLSSIKEEAGGSGPLGNILGGPIERLKHLNLKTENSNK